MYFKRSSIFTAKKSSNFPSHSDLDFSLPKNVEEDELKVVKENGWDHLPYITGMNKSELRLSVIKLKRTGLIRQVIGTYVNYIGDA
jgi:hypothetical protein